MSNSFGRDFFVSYEFGKEDITCPKIPLNWHQKKRVSELLGYRLYTNKMSNCS